MGVARGKVQVRVGGFQTKANPKSVKARTMHGDTLGGDQMSHGTQLGLGSGVKRRKK